MYHERAFDEVCPAFDAIVGFPRQCGHDQLFAEYMIKLSNMLGARLRHAAYIAKMVQE